MNKSSNKKTVGVLTGGGDCPGLNAVIRAVVVKAYHAGWNVIGLEEGWKGLLESQPRPLGLNDVEEILNVGGTILHTSRTNPAKVENGLQRCKDNFKKLGLDALVAIGGEDTLGFAAKLSEAGVPVVGVPKTIDNDLLGTDYTFGFDTAVNIAAEAMDRLRTTAKSHNRTMILEVMGRHAGWIAAYTAIAGGADIVVTPEFSMSVSEMLKILKAQRQRGKKYSLIVVAEGAEIEGLNNATSDSVDAFGHKQLGGLGERLAAALKDEAGKQQFKLDVRSTNLGHIQRGGTPSAADRVLATSYGLFAMKLVLDGEFSKMCVLRGSRIEAANLKLAKEGLKTLPAEQYAVARHFSF